MSGGKGEGYRRCFEAFSDDIVANLSFSITEQRKVDMCFGNKQYTTGGIYVMLSCGCCILGILCGKKLATMIKL